MPRFSNSLLIAAALGFAGCNGTTPTGDAGSSDAGTDGGTDAGVDGGPDAGPDAGEPAFEVGLREAAQVSPLYSIAFDQQGQFLLTLFFVAATPLICDPSQTPPTPQWILELWTPLASGVYEVGPSNSDQYPPLSGQAVVVLRGSAPGSSQPIEVLPSDGRVVIGDAPADSAAELGGTHLHGFFHLGFPTDPVFPSDCFGGEGFGPDGGLIGPESWCLCKDTSGNTVAVCDGGAQDQCCLSTQPDTIVVDGTFDAPPCYLLCIDPETGECQQLLPDGGASP